LDDSDSSSPRSDEDEEQPERRLMIQKSSFDLQLLLKCAFFKRSSRISRRSSGRIISPGRSSTVASLPAPPRPLMTRQNSHSSIQTVIAGETSPSNGFQPENTSPHQRSIGGHGRQRSVAISELMLNGVKSASGVDREERNELPDDSRLSERRIGIQNCMRIFQTFKDIYLSQNHESF